MYARTRNSITPVILTLNEEANIRATLESLSWARRVVVVDSGSTDCTEEIARSFQNVAWTVRQFDSHGEQWRRAVKSRGVSTEYVLALDADMRVTDSLLQEIETGFLTGRFSGGMIPFEFRVHGRKLAGSLCPAQLRLFRPDDVRIDQPGHTQCFSVDGPIHYFASRLVHEDRKSLDLWLESQLRYSRLECRRLESSSTGSCKDRLRLLGVMPAIAAIAAYLRAGGPFGGLQARHYASQRLTYECLLVLQLLESRLSPSNEKVSEIVQQRTSPAVESHD